ncbi:MAG: hypothetical protein R6U40_04695, partial [Desulfobacterales bacterium]
MINVLFTESFINDPFNFDKFVDFGFHWIVLGRLGEDSVLVESFGPDAETLFLQARQIHIVACGTSYHAG